MILEKILNIDNSTDINDILNLYNIRLSYSTQLPLKIKGMLYTDSDCIIHLILNQNLNAETINDSFIHELTHAIEDLPNSPSCLIGLDLQHIADFEIRKKSNAYIK